MSLIMDNIVFSLQKAGGISKFWAKHLLNLSARAVEFECYEASSASDNLFRNEIQIQASKIRTDVTGASLLGRYLPVSLRWEKEAVFHSSYFRNPAKKALPTIHTVHDFMYEKFDRRISRHAHLLQKKTALRRADIIACVSRNTRDDMFTLYPWTRDKRVEVVYNGVDEEFFPILDRKHPLQWQSQTLEPDSFMLYVGSRGYCKNFPFVAELMSSNYCRDNNLKLVCVGGGPFSKNELRLLQDFDLCEQTIWIKSLTTARLNRFYNYARALILPSLYEGFGIPALEAASTGTIVLGANQSSIPEVLGDDTFLFSPFDISEGIGAVEQLDDQRLCKETSRRLLEHSQLFSWEHMTASYMTLYDEARAR